MADVPREEGSPGAGDAVAAEAASEATSSPSGGAEEAKERPRFTVTVTPPDKPAGTGGGAGGAASGGPSGSEARVPVPRGTDVEAAAAACEKLCRLPSPEERRPEGGDGNTGEGFDVNLVYGEVPVRTLANILYNSLCACPEALLDPEKTSRRAFVDLGSGRGQAVLAASMLYPTVLSEARGIEVVPALHAASEEAASAAPKRARSEDVDLPPVSFTHGSFLDSDDKWPEEAIVAFCNSSALDLPTQARLARRAEGMRFGSVFVSTTAPLKTHLFEEVVRAKVPMSWGEATVIVQRRKRLGRWVAGVLGRK